MKCKVGIRHEDKYAMELRVPITPGHVKDLIKKANLDFLVQSSPKRIFRDDEYIAAGAQVTSDVKDAPVIFGVKEVPIPVFEPEKTYIFFSHVIKGQPYNMPMLQHMMDLKCSLIDYEKVTDDQGKRLIFFGKFAGLAGMINSLWSLGERLRQYGISTPFERIEQAHHYPSLDAAKKVISEVGFEIAEKGLPPEICPLTVGFTGYGNVSLGAQEILQLLPVKEISPAELLKLKNHSDLPENVVYKIIFKEEDLSKPRDPEAEFHLMDYYKHPEKYEDQFQQYIPHLSVLMNCMYWDERYPRIVTKKYLKELFSGQRPKLTVIGDVTCDPDGSIECTHKGTPIDDPVFVYEPFTETHESGFAGNGILVMAVDILPSELPRESSLAFGDALFNYVEAVAMADYEKPFDELNLPGPIKRAMILHKGKLTPDYEYIQEYLK